MIHVYEFCMTVNMEVVYECFWNIALSKYVDFCNKYLPGPGYEGANEQSQAHGTWQESQV